MMKFARIHIDVLTLHYHSAGMAFNMLDSEAVDVAVAVLWRRLWAAMAATTTFCQCNSLDHTNDEACYSKYER